MAEKFRCQHCGKKIDDTLCPYCGAHNDIPSYTVDDGFELNESSSDFTMNETEHQNDFSQNTNNHLNQSTPIVLNGVETVEDKYALISIVCGILSIFWLPLVFSIIAIINGNKYQKTGGTKYLSLAKVGKTIGMFVLIIQILVFIMGICLLLFGITSEIGTITSNGNFI